MSDTQISKETIYKYFKCNNHFLIDYGLIPFNKNNISTYNYCLKNFINTKYDIILIYTIYYYKGYDSPTMETKTR